MKTRSALLRETSRLTKTRHLHFNAIGVGEIDPTLGFKQIDAGFSQFGHEVSSLGAYEVCLST